MSKRVFLIVLDSLGIGEMPDADRFGDRGSNTLASISRSENFNVPNLQRLGLFNIEGVSCGSPVCSPLAAVARMAERSNGKDTTIGHWEIAGIISEKPLPTYPDGFPPETIEEFERRTGRKTLCNRPYSGTQAIADYGREHVDTGALIVYTSADSVFQIAAHEEVVPPAELYEYCKIARDILRGEHAVGRVIARPFIGGWPYTRTSNRHDFSLEPPARTLLDMVSGAGLSMISVGKISDIFAGRGVTRSEPIRNNADGMEKTMRLLGEDFSGLCFVNLVDFDMLYGHRNDVDGYAAALSAFDVWLGPFLDKMKAEDLLIITGDHGCDPAAPGTDHSREYTPMLAYGAMVKSVNLKTRESFADIGATAAHYLGVAWQGQGKSFLNDIFA